MHSETETFLFFDAGRLCFYFTCEVAQVQEIVLLENTVAVWLNRKLAITVFDSLVFMYLGESKFCY